MVAAHKYARVMWFAGNGRYVLDYYDEVDMDTPGQSQHNLWSSTGSVFKFVGDAPYQVINGLPQRAQCDSALLRSLAWFPPIAAKDSGFFSSRWASLMRYWDPIVRMVLVRGIIIVSRAEPWKWLSRFHRSKSGWVMCERSSMKTADAFRSWESTFAS